MNLKKALLAAVAAFTLSWSFAAKADIYSDAQDVYWTVSGEIHNYCVMMYTYDTSTTSNYYICVADMRYQAGGVFAMQSANSYAAQDPYNGLVYSMVSDAFWYNP